MPKRLKKVTELRTIDIIVVTNAPFFRQRPNSSAKYAVSTSWNEIVDVSDARMTRRKKIADHTAANGIHLNISGRVTNTSDGPSVGCRPALNTAGNITRPASTDTSSVRIDTLNDVETMLLLCLKYEA